MARPTSRAARRASWFPSPLEALTQARTPMTTSSTSGTRRRPHGSRWPN